MVSSQTGEEVLFTNMDQDVEMDIKVQCSLVELLKWRGATTDISTIMIRFKDFKSG